MTIEKIRKESALPALIADERGFISYVNGKFQEVFGWKPDQIIGKSLATIIPSRLHDAHNLGFSRFLLSGTPTLLNRPLNLKAVTHDGKEFDAEHVIVAEKRDGLWVFGATIRPLA